MVNREDKPYYEITAKEHPEYVAPEDVAKLILRKMKGSLWKPHAHRDACFVRNSKLIIPIFTETAQSALDSDVTDAVITVPFEFAHAQKHALR